MNRWDVRLEAHTVGRFPVPAGDVRAPGDTPTDAILQALRWHHSDNGVPPLRSLILASWPHATATLHVDPRDEELRRARERDARRAA